MATPYDEIAYPTTAFRQTHPDRLATQAALFGLPYAPVRKSRVLDIGCGDGANLIPLAVAYPEAEFVGFDLAPTAIERGRELVSALGLGNIRLEVMDICQTGDLGRAEFDYVIAHGLYAWIPEPVREALIAEIRSRLAPNGVAFVSYNALPGGYVRRMMREMLLYAIRDIDGVAARMEGARREAANLVENYSDNVLFERLVKAEMTELLERPAAVLAHDDLGGSYLPVHLHEFLAHVGRHGLQFLTEASLSRCGAGFRPPFAVDDASFDVPTYVQSLDFRLLRSYREDLLVRAEARPDRRPTPGRLAGLYVTSPARPVEGEPDVFDMGQSRVRLNDPELLRAAGRIGAAWPGALPVAELGFDDEHGAALLRMYWTGTVELHTEPQPFAARPPERPAVSPLARLQAARGGPRLMTLRHTTIEVADPVGLAFIASLDGARTVDEIAADMADQHGAPVAAMKTQVLAKLRELSDYALIL